MVTNKKNRQRKYYEIWESETYQAEIYDNCTASLQVRGDGLRARIIYDTTEWNGNTGGFVQKTEYWDGRQNVKNLMRDFRNLQKKAIKNGMSKNYPYLGLSLVNTCYWDGLID